MHWVRGLAVVVLAITGCALPSSLPTATDLDPPASRVVVIGRFELLPPIIPDLEQQTHWNVVGDDRILNRVLMATGAEATPVDTGIKMNDWQATIEVQWGQPFMIEAERQRTWMRGAMTQLDLMNQDRLWFPGGVFFDVPQGAKAIYIGTLRYTRDDFNNITKVEVIDEYQQTLQALGLGGEGSRVVKSLLTGQ